MEATLVEKKAVSATVKVTVPAQEVDTTFESVLRSLARQVKIPGFRPGRAPRGVLVQRIGEEALGQEVRDALVDANYPKAVAELELAPVHAHFHAHAPEEGHDYEFEVHVDLYPEVVLPDVENIVIDTAVDPVTDAMVADAVEQLRRENATLVPVERPTEAGDYVLLESLSETDEVIGTLPLDLETAQDHLAEQLIGTDLGATIELDLATPDDDPETPEGEDPPEPPAPLRVRLADIKGKEKPDPDDEFAKTLGMEAWPEVDKRVRESLASQLEQQAFEGQRDEFVEKLMAETDFELPHSLLNRRKVSLLENLSEDLKRQDLTLEGYLASLDEKGTRETFDGELEESAANGVRRDILLEQLLEARPTTVSDEDFSGAIRSLAAREGTDVQLFRRNVGEQWLENYRFLMARDRALRETVEELVGGGAEGSDDEQPEGDAS